MLRTRNLSWTGNHWRIEYRIEFWIESNCIFRTDDAVQWRICEKGHARDTISLFSLHTHVFKPSNQRIAVRMALLMTPALSFSLKNWKKDVLPLHYCHWNKHLLWPVFRGGGEIRILLLSSQDQQSTDTSKSSPTIHPPAQSIRMSCRENYFVSMHVKHAVLFIFEYHQFYITIDQSNRVLDYWNSLGTRSNSRPETRL